MSKVAKTNYPWLHTYQSWICLEWSDIFFKKDIGNYTIDKDVYHIQMKGENSLAGLNHIDCQ